MNWEIRPARKEDAAALSSVFALSWKSSYRGMIHDEYLDSLPLSHWEAFLEHGVDSGHIFSFVALREGSVVGGCVARDSMVQRFPDDGELACLYMLPDCKRQGLGTLLMDRAEETLREHGYTHCVLNVLDQNASAIEFYVRRGFEKTPHDVLLTLDEEELTCYMMRKAL